MLYTTKIIDRYVLRNWSEAAAAEILQQGMSLAAYAHLWVRRARLSIQHQGDNIEYLMKKRLCSSLDPLK